MTNHELFIYYIQIDTQSFYIIIDLCGILSVIVNEKQIIASFNIFGTNIK